MTVASIKKEIDKLTNMFDVCELIDYCVNQIEYLHDAEKGERDDLEDRLGAAEESNDYLETEIAAREKEVANLESEIEEINTEHKEEIRELENSLSSAESEIESMKQDAMNLAEEMLKKESTI